MPRNQIVITPGSRPDTFTIYAYDHRGVAHKLPQEETDELLAKMRDRVALAMAEAEEAMGHSAGDVPDVVVG